MPTVASTGPLPPDPHSPPLPRPTATADFVQLLVYMALALRLWCESESPRKCVNTTDVRPTSTATESESVRGLAPAAAVTKDHVPWLHTGTTAHRTAPEVPSLKASHGYRLSCRQGWCLGEALRERPPASEAVALPGTSREGGRSLHPQRASVQLPLWLSPVLSLRLRLPLALMKALLTAVRTTWNIGDKLPVSGASI